MILRTYLILGLVLLGGTAWFIVGQQPPTVQEVPAVPAVTRLQAAGVIPSGEIPENEDIEHGIFVTPPEDEEHLKEAMADMGSMPGMNMGGMDMDGNTGAMDMAGDGKPETGGMDMGGNTGAMDMAGNGKPETGEMDMGGDAGAMDMAGDGKPKTGGMDMGGMDEEAAATAMAQQMAGLVISDNGEFDREITLSMSEWTFSPLDFEVKQGERIRFTVRNDGKLLHEFMFMTMAEMQAIEYRAKRADWSLYEHEALFEKSLLLPGQEISFVATITKPGSWMFMCMLPYHMQMGMMGQMATPGAAMKM